MSVLYMIYGVLLVLLGLALAVLSSSIGAIGGVIGAIAGALLGPLLAVLLAVLVIFGLLYLISGWGLWKGRNWGRWIAAILSVLGLLNILAVILSFSILSLVAFLVNAFFLYVLIFRKDSKDFFGGMQSTPKPS